MKKAKTIRHNWNKAQVKKLFKLPFNDLLFKAHTTHRKYFKNNQVQLSTLLSIKTGSCPEDCAYCPQSAHHNTKLKKEKLIELKRVKEAAVIAKKNGSTRFCMGAAWRNPTDKDLETVCKMIQMVSKLGLETCATLGMLRKEQAVKLAKAGLEYYNHNVDTSENYYRKIITTRKFQDRLVTLNNVREAGLKVCCGGILGMGETLEDRIEMLMTLANLPKHPESVPLNQLIKIPGTPLANKKNLNPLDLIKTIAAARIMMPKSYIRLSAGRTNMDDSTQALAFFAGANSIFQGDVLLTASNPKKQADSKLFDTLGIDPEKNQISNNA